MKDSSSTALLRLSRLRQALERSHEPSAAVAAQLIGAQFDSGDRAGAIETYRHFSLIDSHSAHTDRRVRAAYERALWSVPKTLPTNLPAARTRLVGRHAEIGAIAGALDSGRFVALVGPGGIGKSRLALEVARQSLPLYRDGVWWIDLSSAKTAEDVTALASHALQLDPPARAPAELPESLNDRTLLVVLDCCDNVPEVADALGAALRKRASGVAIVATSQRTIASAFTIALDALPLPPAGAIGRAAAISSDAARLFVERAVDADPRFSLSDDNAETVVEICRLVGASPFAIETAAAYLAHASIDELLSRIRNRALGEVTQATHRSMHWAYHMLRPHETALLRSVSIFPADWTIDDAAAVFGGDARGALERLVKASLVVSQPQRAGLTRYRLLDATRDYAYERMLEDHELESAQSRFVRWAIDAAAHLGDEPRNAHSTEALASLSQSVAAALDISNSSEQWLPGGLELCATLYRRINRLPLLSGIAARVRTLIECAARSESAAASVFYRNALMTHAWLTNYEGDYALALARYQEAIAKARTAGDRASLARALAGVLPVLLNARRFDEAFGSATEALAIGRDIGDVQTCADALRGLSGVYYFQKRFEDALRCYDEFMALDQERISASTVGLMLVGLGGIAERSGDHARFYAALERALSIAHEIGDYGLAAHCEKAVGFILLQDRRVADAHEALQRAVSLSQLGANAMTQLDALEELAAASIRDDQMETLALVLGYADTRRKGSHSARESYLADYFDRLHAVVRSSLGPDDYARAYAAGERASFADVFARVSTLRAGEMTLEEADRFAKLSEREREIARLAARGSSNREIADATRLSVRTVEAHVAAIFRKLGINRREQLSDRE